MTKENPERAVVVKYTDEYILETLLDTSWLTPAFIMDVYRTEPLPKRDPVTRKYEDEDLRKLQEIKTGGQKLIRLGDFLDLQFIRGVSKEPGFPLIGNLPFLDEEFLRFAKEQGVGEDYKMDSIVFFFHLPKIVSYCLLAPVGLRKKSVRALLSSPLEGRMHNRDVFLTVEWTKRAVKYFVDADGSVDPFVGYES